MANSNGGLKGWVSGLKSLLNINVILIICLNCLNSYGNNINNTIRGLAGSQTIGLSAAVVGSAVSVFTIVAFLFRSTYATTIDKLRDKLKVILLAAFIIRGGVFLSINIIGNAVGYYAFFAIDGFLSGFLGTTIPALIGMAVDRKAMGSGLAVMNCITQLVIAPARANAANWFRSEGLMFPSLIAAGCMLAAGVVCLFLKVNSVPGRVQRGPAKPNAQKKGGLLSGISWKLAPFAIVSSVAVVFMGADKTFLNVYAEALNIGSEYTTYQTLGASMGSFISLAVGILCDIINPAILVYIALIGHATGMFLYSQSGNPALFYAGIAIYAATKNMNDVFRILSLKVLGASQAGAASATIFFFNDLFTFTSSTILGIVAAKFGYQTMWFGLGCLGVFNILLFTYVYGHGFKQLAAENADAEAPAEK